MRLDKMPIVLACDYGYIRQIETTIKSIAYHNKETRIYVFNFDIPQEWFCKIRKYVEEIDIEIVDIKLNDIGDFIKKYHKPQSHINCMTFARFLIPLLIKEDKVLYLDCDLLVTGNLENLYKYNISDYYLAASRDVFGLSYGFNAGVLLINNTKWRDDGIFNKLIELANEKLDSVSNGAQDILWMLMGNNYLELSDTFNFQAGIDYKANLQNNYDTLVKTSTEITPLIIHYVSFDKPWNLFSSCRFREKWWEYYFLDWQFIINTQPNFFRSKNSKKNKFLNVLIVTNSDNIEQIEYLVKKNKFVLFKIAAFTKMSNKLKQLIQFENVILYQNVLHTVLEDLIINCDAYLDINHGSKCYDVLNKIEKLNKLILSFDNTKTSESYHTQYCIFKNKEVDKLSVKMLDLFYEKGI